MSTQRARASGALAVLAASVLVGVLAGASWAGILLGFSGGVAVVAGWAPLVAGLRPLASLGRAALPLALPALILVVAGTAAFAPLVAAAVCVVCVLIAWRWILAPELRAPRTPPLHTMRAARIALGALTVIALVLSIVIVYAVHPARDLRQDRGGLPTILLGTAVVLMLGTAVLRLSGYATSRLRAVMSVFVLAAAVRAASSAGVLPGQAWVSQTAPWLSAAHLLTIAAVAVLLSAAAEIAVVVLADRYDSLDVLALRVAVALETPIAPRATTSYASGLGVGAAMLAATVLLAATLAAAISLGNQLVAGRAAASLAPAQPAVAPGRVGDDRALAAMYAPVLVFSQRERWSPTTVEPYLAHATMTGPDRPPVRGLTPAALPTSCPGLATAPCYRLTIGCPDGDERCDMGATHRLGERRRDGAVYVRVVRRAHRPADGSPPAFADIGPYARQASILLQYWFFYPYDRWTTAVLGGQLTQQHEADWEAVMVGLSDSAPLFVAYSEHCGGRWYRWRDIRVANTAKPHIHPYIAVADGSQANYRDANETRTPDWAGCAGVPAGTASLVSYASNIRDRTGTAWTWTPRQIVLADARRPPMSFPGSWGAYDHTTLENLLPHQLGRQGSGPKTPSLQQLWTHPMTTVFCSKHWRPRQCDARR